AVLRRGLVLLAALSFVLSGMASVHTAHAIAGGHDMPAAKTSGDVSSHCDSHEQQAPEAKQDKQFSCCAFACTPLLVLTLPAAFAAAAAHGDVIPLPPAQAVLDRQVAGLFRPPRSLA
ncbi:MAG: hypothetical protein K0S54_3446, partial [Alphaproteobacteria bacterium]|nr:hypothetical protein [Alphaproteobacteria bacterium]